MKSQPTRMILRGCLFSTGGANLFSKSAPRGFYIFWSSKLTRLDQELSRRGENAAPNPFAPRCFPLTSNTQPHHHTSLIRPLHTKCRTLDGKATFRAGSAIAPRERT
jgi:hypothetical protein